MLVPQAFLAVVCLVLGLFPGLVLARAAGGGVARCRGCGLAPELVPGAFGDRAGLRASSTSVAPAVLGVAVLRAALGLAAVLVGVARVTRRVAGADLGLRWRAHRADRVHGDRFSKPLMMIFRAIYRPTREVETLAEVSPYFPREVRYRAEIEPTFERFLYGPLARGVLGLAERMKVLQAGSLHAYLAYVLVLGIVSAALARRWCR